MMVLIRDPGIPTLNEGHSFPGPAGGPNLRYISWMVLVLLLVSTDRIVLAFEGRS